MATTRVSDEGQAIKYFHLKGSSAVIRSIGAGDRAMLEDLLRAVTAAKIKPVIDMASISAMPKTLSRIWHPALISENRRALGRQWVRGTLHDLSLPPRRPREEGRGLHT
jgi:hypothetical protein